MEPALYHSVPDFRGDSLELSRRAAETDRDVIVFCGVRFMAETAKILSPDKTVLLPSEPAGCSLAASITAEDVVRLYQDEALWESLSAAGLENVQQYFSVDTARLGLRELLNSLKRG